MITSTRCKQSDTHNTCTFRLSTYLEINKKKCVHITTTVRDSKYTVHKSTQVRTPLYSCRHITSITVTSKRRRGKLFYKNGESNCLGFPDVLSLLFFGLLVA